MLLCGLKFRKLAVVFGLVAIIAPCAFFFWLFYWDDIWVGWSLPIYPSAKQVGDAYGYYGANSGLKISYYWTADLIQQVEDYYESFTFPFISDSWSKGIVTVFSLDGSELIYVTIEGQRRKLDFPTNKYCHYTQRYKCANVMLVKIGSSGMRSLPQMVSPPSWTNVRPAPPISMLTAGTLIIYSYYVNDF